MIYFCSHANRRALVLRHPTLNGIDFLEVAEDDGTEECGRLLQITLLKDARNLSLDPTQIAISGGSAGAPVMPVSVTPGTDAAPNVISVELDRTGDFSSYTLSLIATPATDDPPDGFDPQLSTVEFSFKAGCPTVGDCLPENCCPPAVRDEPDINYLARDFDGFKAVMLDRMAVLLPGWTETHAADMGIALVELLAYVGDHFSYQQDAIGTEAYLDTARSRISLRRHARLVDYCIDEGSNAGVWVYLEVSADAVTLPGGYGDPSPTTLFFPRLAGFSTVVKPNTTPADKLLASTSVVFAPLQDTVLYREQNSMSIYTWGDSGCCLPAGATQATLTGNIASLTPGTVILFEEVLGPETGNPADADPARRWVVRLTGVEQRDYGGRPLVDPLNGQPITRIWWGAADALPFPLCISATTDEEHGERTIFDVSVARGNLVPADHGIWQAWEDLGAVPPAPTPPVLTASCACGEESPVEDPLPRYHPRVATTPLTFARPYNPLAPATSFLAPPASDAVRPAPQLLVKDDLNGDWTVLSDLLSSPESVPVCVVEIETDGSAYLRFGDGRYGMAPETGTSFRARCRLGNGSAGNIGHDVLAHVVTDVSGITAVRNPLPAAGGVDPETPEHIRHYAPWAFRTQLRAVTEDDYGTVAVRDPAVREARGTFRWTGSWYTAFVSVDATSPSGPDALLVQGTKQTLNRFRMAGVDLEVEGAIIVGLRIEMSICVAAEYFRDDVQAALLRRFISGDLCDGQRGVLNPENFTFGQTIYTSPLIAAAQEVPGVSSATVTRFQRMDDPTADGAARGYLTMGRLEIARCDNDPNRLDHGSFLLHMDGGK
jgi:hypothetical protein